MKAEEVDELLAAVNTIEGIPFDGRQADLWAAILDDTPYDYALGRVREFYKQGLDRRIRVQDIVKPKPKRSPVPDYSNAPWTLRQRDHLREVSKRSAKKQLDEYYATHPKAIEKDEH